MKKTVIAVYVNGEYKQFLKLSEVRLLIDVMKDHKGAFVSIQLIDMDMDKYNVLVGNK